MPNDYFKGLLVETIEHAFLNAPLLPISGNRLNYGFKRFLD